MQRILFATLAALALASPAGAQQGVNLATNTSAFLVSSSPNPAALGAVDFDLSYTFPGASSPVTFTITGITDVTDSPNEYFTMNAGNAASFGLDWSNLVASFGSHHPGYGNVSPGPITSIDTDLGTFSNPFCCGHWNFIRYTKPDGSTAPMVPTQLQVRITDFYQSQVDTGTVFTASTILSGVAFLIPEPSACAMLLPGVVLLLRRRYHG